MFDYHFKHKGTFYSVGYRRHSSSPCFKLQEWPRALGGLVHRQFGRRHAMNISSGGGGGSTGACSCSCCPACCCPGATLLLAVGSTESGHSLRRSKRAASSQPAEAAEPPVKNPKAASRYWTPQEDVVMLQAISECGEVQLRDQQELHEEVCRRGLTFTHKQVSDKLKLIRERVRAGHTMDDRGAKAGAAAATAAAAAAAAAEAPTAAAAAVAVTAGAAVQ